MSSGIPVYAVVDKSKKKKKNQDERGSVLDVIVTSDVQLPRDGPDNYNAVFPSDATPPDINFLSTPGDPTLCNAALDTNASDLNAPPLPVKRKKNLELVSLYELVDDFRGRKESNSVHVPSPAEQPSTGDGEVLTPAKSADNCKPPVRPLRYQIIVCLAVVVLGLLTLAALAVSLISGVYALGLEADIAALQRDFSELRQNCSQSSEVEGSVAASADRISEELAELSQLLDRNHEELSQNYSQLYIKFKQLESNVTKSLVYSEVQRLRSELECAFINTSCSDLPSYCPSGYYSMRDRFTAPVYCNMALTCGNITGGWVRVAELNMTDTSQQCPGDLVERNETGIRQCRIDDNRCFSVYYSTADVSYLKVCGKITAYQVGSTNAFRQFYENRNTATIDSNYVAGVSLTHGTSPRQHIWTFAAALDRNDDVMGLRNSHCPCRFDVDPFDPPPFVGEDYFCDAGYEEFMEGETGLQTDPLWDGTDCLCCNNPPWFYKQLPQPTTDDIEMRVCKDGSGENIAITEIEIYVQ